MVASATDPKRTAVAHSSKGATVISRGARKNAGQWMETCKEGKKRQRGGDKDAREQDTRFLHTTLI